MRQVTARGRWLWGLSGLVTMAAIAIPGARLITFASDNQGAQPHPVVTRTVTVSQPVTSLNVQSYGMPVQVRAAAVRQVTITETISYDPKAGPPPVTYSVSGGRLTLTDQACSNSDCGVGFTVTVPRAVAVTVATQGGQVTVSGTARTNLDSGGGPINVADIHGPLTVSAGDGTVEVNGLTGPLYADTGGGELWAQGVHATTATVITGGGNARIAFTAPVDTVVVSTDGGAATMAVPGGPYALTTDADGGPQTVGVPISPTARHSITVTSGGGPLVIVALANRFPAPTDEPPPAPPPPSSAP